LDNKSLKHSVIFRVEPDSIADEIGIRPGDILADIDGLPIRDVFDYRLRELAATLSVGILHPDGTSSEVLIEKDEDEELGIVFQDDLMDDCRSCSNKCVFCFVDQLPEGMRSTMYFKDDDLRMSYLNGNFVTLTNLKEEEFDRLLSYHLSPLNVSVHATEPELRVKMMNNQFAGHIMERLRKAVACGIDINAQLVLCPGLNDGPHLDKSIDDLSELGEHLVSVALVPVGLTRFRDARSLYPLRPFDQESAREVIAVAERYQKFFLKKFGRRIVFLADEFYIRAGMTIPRASHYEGFYQLENGVGLLACRRAELFHAISKRKRRKTHIAKTREHISALTGTGEFRIAVISGVDAANYISESMMCIVDNYGINVEVVGVPNDFFGHSVTVTGLLTGQDILKAISGLAEMPNPVDVVFIPDVTLRSGEDVFLDDMTVRDMVSQSTLPIIVYETTGEGFISAIENMPNVFSQNSREER
jgi:putative radical SAM enzyme (TIGR03279 family)